MGFTGGYLHHPEINSNDMGLPLIMWFFGPISGIGTNHGNLTAPLSPPLNTTQKPQEIAGLMIRWGLEPLGREERKSELPQRMSWMTIILHEQRRFRILPAMTTGGVPGFPCLDVPGRK